jgi:hypothetical protein
MCELYQLQPARNPGRKVSRRFIQSAIRAPSCNGRIGEPMAGPRQELFLTSYPAAAGGLRAHDRCMLIDPSPYSASTIRQRRNSHIQRRTTSSTCCRYIHAYVLHSVTHILLTMRGEVLMPRPGFEIHPNVDATGYDPSANPGGGREGRGKGRFSTVMVD